MLSPYECQTDMIFVRGYFLQLGLWMEVMMGKECSAALPERCRLVFAHGLLQTHKSEVHLLDSR